MASSYNCNEISFRSCSASRNKIFKLSRSHVQNCRHNYIWLIALNTFFRTYRPMTIQVEDSHFPISGADNSTTTDCTKGTLLFYNVSYICFVIIEYHLPYNIVGKPSLQLKDNLKFYLHKHISRSLLRKYAYLRHRRLIVTLH